MDLVVSNLAGNLDALAALAREQAPYADVLELRLDACASATTEDLARAFASLPRPVLAAVNGPEAYGSFSGSDADRLALLRRASEAGAAWIDVPWTLARDLGPLRARRVVSRHVLDGTPPDLEALVAEVERVAGPADRVKLVTHATCAEDGLRVLRLARSRARAGRPIAAFASGAAGSFTRALAPVFGSLATYSAPARGTGGGATAPGQLEADQLCAMWPAGGASPATRILGVVGRPVGASLSPRLHGAALRCAGIDAVYVAFEPAEFDAFLALCADVGVHGLSVTMPFKAEAARLATSRDDAVIACGAANTLLRTEDGWRASNTDASAVRTCILRALHDTDQPLTSVVAAVVGTGGAARAALHALQGACLVVTGRDAAKRDALAREFGAEACTVDDLHSIPHDVLVNTTPLGSRAHPGAMAVPASALREGSLVLDAVYRPAETPLLAAARAIGARTIEGREWFLEQAIAQFTAFTDADAPAESMRVELARALAEDGP
ncbi:MAG: type I 3-dehydroquinate dehydratase [Planctomycetota bacterium]|nr:type I 3-dehydroquinate dehydratase [Planctomycetota bacterium]